MMNRQQGRFGVSSHQRARSLQGLGQLHDGKIVAQLMCPLACRRGWCQRLACGCLLGGLAAGVGLLSRK